jgi:hypothetical protein
MPLRSIPGCSEYGEGDAGIAGRSVSTGLGQEDGDGVEGMRVWSGWQEVERPRGTL